MAPLFLSASISDRRSVAFFPDRATWHAPDRSISRRRASFIYQTSKPMRCARSRARRITIIIIIAGRAFRARKIAWKRAQRKNGLDGEKTTRRPPQTGDRGSGKNGRRHELMSCRFRCLARRRAPIQTKTMPAPQSLPTFVRAVSIGPRISGNYRRHFKLALAIATQDAGDAQRFGFARGFAANGRTLSRLSANERAHQRARPRGRRPIRRTTRRNEPSIGPLTPGDRLSLHQRSSPQDIGPANRTDRKRRERPWTDAI